MSEPANKGKTSKVNAVQRQRNKQALVADYEGNYDKFIQGMAQDVAPQLFESLVEMAEGTQWLVDEDGVFELDEDMRRIPMGDRIPKSLQKSAINDVLGIAKTTKDPLEELAKLGAGGSGGFNITINQFGSPKESADTVVQAIHDKVENAKVVRDVDSTRSSS